LAVVLVSIIGLAIAAWSGGSKSEERVSLDQVPAAVKATILDAAKGGTIKEIERETKGDRTIYEAEIVIGGKVLEVEIAPDGKVLGWEAEDDEDEDEDDEDEVEGDDDDDDDDEVRVSLDQLPAAVRATILKEAKGGKIKEIELEHGVYEADVLVELEIKVAPDGRLLSRKIEKADDDDDDEHEARGHDDDDEDDDDDEHLSLDQLPDAVAKTIREAAGGAPIREIERETKGSSTIYEAEIVIDGKEIEIEVAPDGTLLGKEADDEDDDDDDDD